jgi:hypothetical protein
MQGGKEVDVIDFVLTQKGEAKQINVEVFNGYNDTIELQNPFSADNDVKILKFTKELKAQTFGIIVLEFKPSLERKESLKLKDIGFQVVVG